MAKKINLDEIDESYIVAMTKKDRTYVPENPDRLLSPEKMKVQSETTVITEQPKEEKRKRRGQDYENLFIRESNVTARLGKSVYIRKEYHDRILKIVHVVGDNEVSLSGYIDNVLAHHFDCFKEDISQAYKQNISTDVF
jgi:hypothetical protein